MPHLHASNGNVLCLLFSGRKVYRLGKSSAGKTNRNCLSESMPNRNDNSTNHHCDRALLYLTRLYQCGKCPHQGSGLSHYYSIWIIFQSDASCVLGYHERPGKSLSYIFDLCYSILRFRSPLWVHLYVPCGQQWKRLGSQRTLVRYVYRTVRSRSSILILHI